MDRCSECELDADYQTCDGGDGFSESRDRLRYQPEMASLTPPMNATPGSSRTMTDVTVSDASVCGWNTATVAATIMATTPAMSCAKKSGQPLRVRALCAPRRETRPT